MEINVNIERMKLELAELKLYELMKDIEIELEEINREVDFEKDIDYINALITYSENL